jgi:23S rRNA (cytosine1962-C5)-methyltransferase
MRSPQLVLKAGKEKSLRLGHPWIFSGAIQTLRGKAEDGSQLDVVDHKGQFLARAYYNAQSSIVARVFSRHEGENLDLDLLLRRIRSAWERRQALRTVDTNMQRVVASEADLLPGLIIDHYAGWVVFQILTKGMDVLRSAIVQAIQEIFEPIGIVERSDEAIRTKEGLEPHKALVSGDLKTEGVLAREQGMQLWVNLWEGHKTGFYLDQRLNRQWVGRYAEGAEVLNCFSYTGGFSVAAGYGGAKRVISVDESRPALDLAARNWQLNVNRPEAQHETVRADVFAYLRQLREQGAQFDLIIMDPPKFVSDKHHIDRACRGYKDLNLLAMQLLREGGHLATFSCSGLVSRDLFQKVVFGASVDASCDMQILHHLSQAEDHPTLLSFPESLYLKGLMCRKISGAGGSRA